MSLLVIQPTQARNGCPGMVWSWDSSSGWKVEDFLGLKVLRVLGLSGSQGSQGSQVLRDLRDLRDLRV